MTADIRDTIRELYAVLEAYYADPKRPDQGDRSSQRVACVGLTEHGQQCHVFFLAARPTGFVRLEVAERMPIWLTPAGVAIVREGLGDLPDPSIRVDPAEHARMLLEIARLKAREIELQNDASRHEREARIARALLEHREAVSQAARVEREIIEAEGRHGFVVPSELEDRDDAACERLRKSLEVLASYGVGTDGNPLPEAEVSGG